jgi:hypothetical protein
LLFGIAVELVGTTKGVGWESRRKEEVSSGDIVGLGLKLTMIPWRPCGIYPICLEYPGTVQFSAAVDHPGFNLPCQFVAYLGTLFWLIGRG